MTDPLPQPAAKFAAAELQTRREIARRALDSEEAAVLGFFVERSFPLGRTAAYFRSFAHLGASVNLLRSHACEAFKRLVAKNVLAPLPLANQGWHWYGINVVFDQWKVAELARPVAFTEEQRLPWEPELMEALSMVFVQSFSAVHLDRGRDAGPASEHRAAENWAAEATVPQLPFTDQATKKVTPQDWERLRGWIRDGSRPEDSPVPVPSVPFKGTCSQKGNSSPKRNMFPSPSCSQKRNTEIINDDAGETPIVPMVEVFPRARAHIASLASCTEAELAIAVSKKGTVPQKGTPGGPSNQKIERAWAWLNEIDTSGGLKVKRFEEQWKNVCQQHPDYVLDVLPNVIKAQIKLHGKVGKPLALCATAARADHKLR